MHLFAIIHCKWTWKVFRKVNYYNLILINAFYYVGTNLELIENTTTQFKSFQYVLVSQFLRIVDFPKNISSMLLVKVNPLFLFGLGFGYAWVKNQRIFQFCIRKNIYRKRLISLFLVPFKRTICKSIYVLLGGKPFNAFISLLCCLQQINGSYNRLIIIKKESAFLWWPTDEYRGILIIS